MTPPDGIVFSEEEQAQITALTETARKKEVERKAQEQAADEKVAGVDYHSIAQELLRKGDLLSFNNTVYRYKNGVFSEDKGQLESEILIILQYRGIGAKEKITTATSQVKHYILYDAPCSEYPFNLSPNAVPLDNGVLILDFETGTVHLVDHSPEFRFNYKLRVRYNPDASKEAVSDYLGSLGVDTDLLLQIPAHAILSMMGRVYKRAYFLKGDRDSGKSTFIRLVTHNLFGPSVCANVSLHDLLFDRFRLAELDGKVINAYADLADSKVANLGLFKALTGGDAVEVEKKHRDPYSMVNKAVFLFSANRYPKIKGADDAYWSRWIAINFDKTFSRDPDFELKQFGDDFVSGFLLLIIERMGEIMKSRELITTANVERDWLTDASSGYAFIRDCLERCKGAILVKKDLYAAYIEYCNDAEFEKESQKDLTELLKQAGAIDAYPKIKGRQEHCYQGFKIKESDPKYPDSEGQNTLDSTSIQRREKTTNMQDMQANSILSRTKEKEENSTSLIKKVSCQNPAYPAYEGLTRAELTKILEKHFPNDPPNQDAFQAAWKKAGEAC
jgi:P4 family phage/plasmid primase-like protien